MNNTPEISRSKSGPPAAHSGGGGRDRHSFKKLLWSLVGLTVCFSWPLYDLALFSLREKLYSHILLIPFISLYLVWQESCSFTAEPNSNRSVAIIFGALGLLAVLAQGTIVLLGLPQEPAAALVLPTFSFVSLIVSSCGAFLGRNALRAWAFPLGFLAFMIPMPEFVVLEIESWLQVGSALVATAFFRVVGTPLFREDLILQLPGIRLQVAPECSGIHSSFALLITSVLAGYFFLRSPVARVLLAVAVIPIALLRNGFRIFTIGELCVHISPDMIHSYIHTHGGPLFFALSLIPFFALLFGLIRFERKQLASASRPSV